MFTPNALAVQATNKAIEEIGAKWGRLSDVLGGVASGQIEAVNIAYEIGLDFQEICQHKQLKLSFFENIKGKLPGNLSFATAQKCVHLANSRTGPVTTLLEAQQAMQQVLQIGGLLEDQHRDTRQKSHEVSPVTFFFKAFSTAKESIKKEITNVDKWDSETREGILTEIQRQRKFLDEVEKKLKG